MPLIFFHSGLSHFPNDVRLNICLGVSLMNLADYDQALARFLEFPDEKDAVQFAARCYEALGDQRECCSLYEKNIVRCRKYQRLIDDKCHVASAELFGLRISDFRLRIFRSWIFRI